MGLSVKNGPKSGCFLENRAEKSGFLKIGHFLKRERKIGLDLGKWARKRVFRKYGPVTMLEMTGWLYT